MTYEIPAGVTNIIDSACQTVCERGKTLIISEYNQVIDKILKFSNNDFELNYRGIDSKINIIDDGHGLITERKLVWSNSEILSNDLIEVIAEDSIKYPGEKLVINCPNLSAIEQYAVKKLNNLKYVKITGNPEISPYMFEPNTDNNLLSLDMPDYNRSFDFDNYNLKQLKYINIPNVTVIEKGFGLNKGFTFLTLPNIISVGNGAFNDCNLECIFLPALTAVGSYAFENCQNLRQIDCPSLKIVKNGAFSGCTTLVVEGYNEDLNITAISDIKGVEQIEAGAFKGCKALTELEFNKLSVIEPYAFQDCTGLRKFSAPNVKSIGWSAFSYCNRLSSIEMPDIYQIDYMAFSNCKALSSITLKREINGIEPEKLPKILPEHPFADYDVNHTYRYDKTAFNDCSITVRLIGYSDYDIRQAIYDSDQQTPSNTMFGSNFVKTVVGKLNTPNLKYCKLNNQSYLYTPQYQTMDFTYDKLKSVQACQYPKNWIFSDGETAHELIFDGQMWKLDGKNISEFNSNLINDQTFPAEFYNLKSEDGKTFSAYALAVPAHYEFENSSKWPDLFNGWDYMIANNHYSEIEYDVIDPQTNKINLTCWYSFEQGRLDIYENAKVYPNTDNPCYIYKYDENNILLFIKRGYKNDDSLENLRLITKNTMDDKMFGSETPLFGNVIIDGIQHMQCIKSGAFEQHDQMSLIINGVYIEQNAFIECQIERIQISDSSNVNPSAFKSCRIREVDVYCDNFNENIFNDCEIDELNNNINKN